MGKVIKDDGPRMLPHFRDSSHTCSNESPASFCDSSKVPVLELPSGPLVVSWHPVLALGFFLSRCIFFVGNPIGLPNKPRVYTVYIYIFI